MGSNGKNPNGRFFKGDPRAGRPKGTKNKATVAVREMCVSFLDKNYWPTLEDRWKEGKVTWPEMQTLLAYGYGKPKETHEHTGLDGGPIETVSRIEWALVDGKNAKN
jgi:hypothetical protein